MKNFDVFVGGHLALEVYPGLQTFLPGTFLDYMKPGKLLYVENASFCTGGPVSNTGLALHKLGLRVCLFGKVGKDDFGAIVKRLMESHSSSLAKATSQENSVKTRSIFSLVSTDEVGTSYTMNLSPPGIDRIFLHYPGANNTFTYEDVDFDLVSKSRIFHFGYPPLMRGMFADRGENLSKIMQKAKECGVFTSLDMALPDPNSEAGQADWEGILQKTLPFVDLFAPSIEEILYMADRELYQALMADAKNGDIIPLIAPQHLHRICDRLSEWGAKILLIKLGERGLFLQTPGIEQMENLKSHCDFQFEGWENQQIWSPCFKADLVGATGSGDATIAGFLSGLIRSLSVDEVVQSAVAVGACCVEALDTLSGIREWEETSRRIDSGWEKHDLGIDEPGWNRSEQYQHWKKRNK